MYRWIIFLLLFGTVKAHAECDNGCMRVEDCFLAIEDPYITIGGGAVFPLRVSSVKTTSIGAVSASALPISSVYRLPEISWKNTYKTGYEINVAAGIPFYRHWKLEGELLYQTMERELSGFYSFRQTNSTTGNQILQTNGNQVQRASSKASLYTVMANLYYEFRNCNPWTASLGVGMGIAWLRSELTKRNNTLHVVSIEPPVDVVLPTRERSPTLKGSAFAWQAKAGIGYAITDCISLGLNYRLLGTMYFRASRSSITTNYGTPEAAKLLILPAYCGFLMNNSVNLSLDYRF